MRNEQFLVPNLSVNTYRARHDGTQPQASAAGHGVEETTQCNSCTPASPRPNAMVVQNTLFPEKVNENMKKYDFPATVCVSVPRLTARSQEGTPAAHSRGHSSLARRAAPNKCPYPSSL
ncbi:hypothetical protein E2C01_010885 [Portunus trituberculatus]|uniref:Uncharacterized protein n=1 Tax=Portunus trituberculatus TaxID=210409 RepID=A0A5B7D9K8_PORTR|nr:hypothetical protein [Portunus trituberculatus]